MVSTLAGIEHWLESARCQAPWIDTARVAGDHLLLRPLVESPYLDLHGETTELASGSGYVPSNSIGFIVANSVKTLGRCCARGARDHLRRGDRIADGLF